MKANNGLLPRAWRFTIIQLFVFVAICGAALAYWQSALHSETPHRTGRTLDVAIFGRGFFQVLDPATGEFRYTRDGHVLLNSSGDFLIGRPADELLIQPQFTLPSDWTEVEISRNGTVAVQQSGGSLLTHIGQLQLACFLNEEGLQEEQPGLFRETDFSGPPRLCSPGSQGAGTLLQGWLASNSIKRALLAESSLQGMALGAIAIGIVWLTLEIRRQRRTLDTLLVRLPQDGACSQPER